MKRNENYAAPGDTGHLRYGDLMPVKVQKSCDGQAGQWACIEHALIFAHNMERDGHTGNRYAAPCRLVWVCTEHGVEAG